MPPHVDERRTSDSTRNWTSRLSVLLFVATIVVYLPAIRCDFISLDDNVYVTQNAVVQQGLTAEGLTWSLTASVSSNWHPVTMWSHMAVCHVFGLHPAAHHGVNVLLHAIAAVLLFRLLVDLTGAVAPSAIVAALFAVHPLHVESVAWVAERKDVLSTVLLFATLAVYVRWVRSRRPWHYVLMLIAYVAALASKPMVVTAPCLMLLIDVWPLGRISTLEGGDRPAATIRQLVWEKVPLFLLAGLSSAITLQYQMDRAVRTFDAVPLTARTANAIVAYVDYLRDTIWPTSLGIFYPHPHEDLPIVQVLFSALLLVGVTVGAVVRFRRQPYLLVAWCWYLGTLVPVIGLIQVGGQARADRYTYVPLVGIFVALVWAVADYVTTSGRRTAVTWLTAIVLTACALVTWNQLKYWRDSVTLFAHTIQVTGGSHLAQLSLANALANQGQFQQALMHYDEALSMRPNDADTHFGHAFALQGRGDLVEAVAEYRRALELGADSTLQRATFAQALVESGAAQEGVDVYESVLKDDPDLTVAHAGLGMAYARLGRIDDAVFAYHRALERDPDHLFATVRLARILAAHPDPANRDGAQAVRLGEKARALNPQSPEVLDTLAIAYAEVGRFDDAGEQAAEAVRLARALARQSSDDRFIGIANEIQGRIDRYIELGRPYREDPVAP